MSWRSAALGVGLISLGIAACSNVLGYDELEFESESADAGAVVGGSAGDFGAGAAAGAETGGKGGQGSATGDGGATGGDGGSAAEGGSGGTSASGGSGSGGTTGDGGSPSGGGNDSGGGSNTGGSAAGGGGSPSGGGSNAGGGSGGSTSGGGSGGGNSGGGSGGSTSGGGSGGSTAGGGTGGSGGSPSGGGSGGSTSGGGSGGSTSGGGSGGSTSGGGSGGTGGTGGTTTVSHKETLSSTGSTGKEAKIPICCTPSSTEKARIDEGFKLLNQYRMSKGKSALAYDNKLAAAMLGHCHHMGVHTFWGHDAPEAKVQTPWVRAELCGTSANGENIYAGSTSASGAMTAWKNSSGHNANMLSTSFKRVGIGNYQGYWGQLFAQ